MDKWKGYYNYFENSLLLKAMTILSAYLLPGERLSPREMARSPDAACLVIIQALSFAQIP